MRKEYKLTPAQLERLVNACKPTPVMYLPGGRPMFGTPQENANVAWEALGKELGFIGLTAQPVPGKGPEYFTAEPEQKEKP